MKRLFTILAVLFSCLSAFAQDIDAVINKIPRRLVNDHARVLSKEENQKLEKKLVQFDNTSSTQMAVLLINTLQGRNLEATASKIFNTWGIGQKEKNNGLLILAVIHDRKLRIEVGRGLESVITNEEAARIIKEEIAPAFRESKYFQGLDKATSTLMTLAKQAFPDTVKSAAASAGLQENIPSPTSYDYAKQNTYVSKTNSGLSSGIMVAIVLVVLIFGIAIVSAILKNVNRGGLYSGAGYRSYGSFRSLGSSFLGGLFTGWLFQQWFSRSNRQTNDYSRSSSNNSGYDAGGSDFGGFDGGSSGDAGADSSGGSSGHW